MKLIEHIIKYCIKKLTKNKESIVLALSQGIIASRVLTLAKQLDLHTHLRDGPLSLEALAERTQTHSPTLRRFLDTMASLGIVEKQGDSRYAKTGVTEQLDLLTEYFSGDMAYHAWDAMRHTLKTGEPGWNKVHGASFYAVLNKNPTLSAEFDQWNEKTCDLGLSPVVSQYDFSKFKTLADLGGGKGQFLTQVLQANPGMSGILFDRPIVTRLAESFFKERKLRQHYKVIGGSLLDSKLPVADLYSICRVLLNMNDEQVLQVLKNVKAAMRPRSRLLIIDAILGDRQSIAYPFAMMNDLQLFMLMGGQTRTKDQWSSIITQAGLTVLQVIDPKRSHFSIIEVGL